MAIYLRSNHSTEATRMEIVCDTKEDIRALQVIINKGLNILENVPEDIQHFQERLNNVNPPAYTLPKEVEDRLPVRNC